MARWPARAVRLLLAVTILLEVAMIVNPPRFVVFARYLGRDSRKGALATGAIAQLEFEPGQVQAAKARMLRKLEKARALLTRAEEEEQQAETAIEQAIPDGENPMGAHNEVSNWYIRINGTHEAIEEAKRAVGSLGNGTSLVELKRAGGLTNECVSHASATVDEMEELKEFWQARAGGPPGGV